MLRLQSWFSSKLLLLVPPHSVFSKYFSRSLLILIKFLISALIYQGKEVNMVERAHDNTLDEIWHLKIVQQHKIKDSNADQIMLIYIYSFYLK